MSFHLKSAAIGLMFMVAMLGFAGAADADSVVGVYPFQNTGASPPSHYGNGNAPESELLQASDGNFYGTTTYGGAGLCGTPDTGIYGKGCGTIFRVNSATGVETVIYSFPYYPATKTAPDGAYPRSGLIQGKDGALYGVAGDGGIPGCGGVYGCGTMFRISTAGGFTLLHQFCGDEGCAVVEGSRPTNHLVQTADGTLYGTTSKGGDFNGGTLFSATTAGAVTTLHYFQQTVGDGSLPYGALLIGHDGSTLYGTTEYGGAYSRGTVFSYGAAGLQIIHSFNGVNSAEPEGALIYGADGLLYGTTTVGAIGATVYSLSTTGDGFAVDATASGVYTVSGLLLGTDGMMYGTILGENAANPCGGLFVYNPATKAAQTLVLFRPDTGGNPFGVLIEGWDHYLYGTNAGYGGSDSFGPDEGTLYRVGPPLP